MAEIQIDTLAASPDPEAVPQKAQKTVPETVQEPFRTRTEVFAVHGADPEVLAYAMAKYSRSSLSMKEALKEISGQRAEQFLNTFYFQYGHRSIADLAHVAFAIERLSLLAAISSSMSSAGTDRSVPRGTRISRRAAGTCRTFGTQTAWQHNFYRDDRWSLFTAYHELAEGMFESLKAGGTKPAEMKAGQPTIGLCRPAPST